MDFEDLTEDRTFSFPDRGGEVVILRNGVFYENDQTVTQNYTLTAGKNAMSAGPVTVNSGVTVTVPTGAAWTVV